MDFKDYYLSLSETQRVEFCNIAEISPQYMRTHLVYRRKVPQPKTMDGIVLALNTFNAPINRQDLLNFFYPPTSVEEQKEADRRSSLGRREADAKFGRRTRKLKSNQ